MKEVVIDGEVFVRKSDIKNVSEKVSGKIFMVRSYGAGVFYGEIKKRTQTVSGLVVLMKNARRVWCWYGAASLSQLAVDGTSEPSKCQFPCKVSEVELQNVIEIIPCTEKAIKSLEGVPEWKK